MQDGMPERNSNKITWNLQANAFEQPATKAKRHLKKAA